MCMTNAITICKGKLENYGREILAREPPKPKKNYSPKIIKDNNSPDRKGKEENRKS